MMAPLKRGSLPLEIELPLLFFRPMKEVQNMFHAVLATFGSEFLVHALDMFQSLLAVFGSHFRIHSLDMFQSLL